MAFNAASSSGSNLGPTNESLGEAIATRVLALRAADPGNTQPIPSDLVMASGSGLDPDISPASAYYQISRVARVRGLSASRLAALVSASIEGRQFGVLGEPRVNVLHLNLALDQLAPAARSARRGER
jgi:K+-transporting ATPase ATPase C chain